MHSLWGNIQGWSIRAGRWCRGFATATFDAIPILNSAFWRAGTSAHADAIKEFLLVFTIALMPFWLGALMTLATSFGTQQFKEASSWYEFLVQSQYSRGQLFLAAASALGTVLWLSLKEWKQGHFPDRLWFVLASLVIAVVAAAFYGLEYAYGPEQFKLKIPSRFLIVFSEGVMVATCVLYYVSSVLNNALIGLQPQDDMRQRDTEFADRYAQHRGG